ncbi:hypothetical protein V5799_030793 [Amblyomma americanum]|uniref:Secreted protein n=1 Tax=Amblyomma americanum TaxID=6943 RepID=A0AAQ4EM24_AMBAM
MQKMKTALALIAFMLVIMATEQAGDYVMDYQPHGRCIGPCSPRGFPPFCAPGCSCHRLGYSRFSALCMKNGVIPPAGWRRVPSRPPIRV